MAILLRAYIRKVPGLSVAAQDAMADKDGVPKAARYREDKTAITSKRADAIALIRADSRLWVADNTVLADNRGGLIAVLELLTAKKVSIHEGRTGRVSLAPHDGQGMAINALARWASANKTFGGLTPSEAGGLGGKRSTRNRRKIKLPKSDASSVWHDKALAHLNTDQIVAKVNLLGHEHGFEKPWTVSSLYRTLGARGAFAGPKMRKK